MLRNILTFILNFPIFILSKFIIRNPNVWVFGAWFGKNYSDNSKYLFEYVNKNCKDITAVWITNNNKTYDLVKKKGYKVVKTYSLAGYYYTLIAKYGFVSVHHIDINYYASLGMKIINLWHGIPLKKILKDDNVTGYNNRKKHPVYSKLRELLLQEYYSTIATSDAVAEIYKSAFNGLTERVDIIGQPRCDVFYLPPAETSFTEKLRKIKEKNKLAIYMPTHRQEGKIDFSKFLTDELDTLNNKMKEYNVVLLVKLHFYHQKDLDNLNNEYSNIIFVKGSDIEQDIYSILSMTDFLITDYSSIYFDYLHSNKPIIFFAFDKEDYLKNDRAFYFDYEEITPGEKAYNWNELYEKVAVIANGIDNYANERKKTHDIFNKYQDGKNCERVVEWIKSLDNKQTFDNWLTSEGVVDAINSLTEESK